MYTRAWCLFPEYQAFQQLMEPLSSRQRKELLKQLPGIKVPRFESRSAAIVQGDAGHGSAGDPDAHGMGHVKPPDELLRGGQLVLVFLPADLNDFAGVWI